MATPLLLTVTVTYVSRLANQTAAEVYPFCMAAFGITAALAGICFTIRSTIEHPHPISYAGAKFLHSSLLLIQTLMIAYVRDGLIQSGWWNGHHTLSTIAKMFLTTVAALLCGAAAFAWYFGFEALNEELWSNWGNQKPLPIKTGETKQSIGSEPDDKTGR